MQPTVTIYTTPTCSYCHMAKEYFKDKGVEYDEKDITTDQEALAYVLEKVGQAVTPIITIDQDIIIGFDRQQIDEALSKYKGNAPEQAA